MTHTYSTTKPPALFVRSVFADVAPPLSVGGGTCADGLRVYVALSVVFGALSAFLLGTTVLMVCRNQTHKGYTYLNGE